MEEPITLSLFDGMSNLQIALNRMGMKPKKYYASEIDKYPVIVAQANYPDTIQLGDVTKWKEWDIDWASIDLVAGGFPCFVAGTLVTTSKGLKPIEDIEKSDMVITHNHQFKNVVIPMVKVSDHYNIVDIRGSHELKVTDEHPFYVREVYSKDSISEPKWVNCVDLNSSHYIGVPLNRNSITPSISSDIDFWYKIGLYVSTDYTQYNNILCKDTLNLIQTFGHESNKEIPSFLFDTSIDIIKSFLEGFLQNNTNTVSTTSERFAYGIIQLIQKVYNTQSEITKQEQTYTIRFSKERQDTDDYIVEEGFIWTPFKSKVRIINSIKVYNFEVADDNSYSVNNLIVHNCQAWSMAGKQQGDKDERGKLFWVLLDIIKHVLDSNPNAKYIIENVKMKKVFEEYITSHTENALGIVHKTLINSALLSAQNRNRYYWTNFEVSHPEDKGITWGDVRDTGVCF